MRNLPGIVLAVLLLASCKVGPDYKRPAVDTPAAFPHAIESTADTTDTLWWTLFGDPVLDQLVNEALANNRNVKIAVTNVESAAAVLTQTRSQLFPQIQYSGEAQRARSSEAGTSPAVARLVTNPQTSYQTLVGASWELDLWGRIRRQTEAAQANLLSTREAYRGVVLTLVSSVVNSYIQLRALDEQLTVAKNTLHAYEESVKLFTLQFKYGQIARIDLAQARSQYETAAVQIPPLESQIVQTQNSLSLLLGRNPGEIARGKAIGELALPAVPSGIPSTLLERRPDILQAEQQLVAANAQVGAAKALYFPSISLTGAAGSASPELSQLFTGPARVWSFAGQVSGPIFTFGGVSGQVEQTEATRRGAVQNYTQSIQNAFADVDNALVISQKSQDQLAAQERLVAALKDYANLAHLQYGGGYAPYSTVLQAEQTLFPAELTLASLRASVFSASANIYKAMGGGWVTKAEALTNPAQQGKNENATPNTSKAQ